MSLRKSRTTWRRGLPPGGCLRISTAPPDPLGIRSGRHTHAALGSSTLLCWWRNGSDGLNWHTTRTTKNSIFKWKCLVLPICRRIKDKSVEKWFCFSQLERGPYFLFLGAVYSINSRNKTTVRILNGPVPVPGRMYHARYDTAQLYCTTRATLSGQAFDLSHQRSLLSVQGTPITGGHSNT